MAAQNHTPVIVGGYVRVTGHLVGRSLIDGLRGIFTIGGQLEEGDYFMDQSRDLLERHFQLIQLRDQTVIRHRYLKARNLKDELDSEDYSGSQLQKLIQARNYKRISKKTYKIVKNASDRTIDDHLMNQIANATQQDGSGSGPGTGSVASGRNPFTDSHAVSTLTDVAVDDLDRVEMTTYHAENTDGAAVVLDLVGQDDSVQHVVGTFSTDAFSGDTSDREVPQSIPPEAPAALSLHREDGTVPQLVAASPPDLEVESRTVASMAITETSEDGSVSNPYGAYV